MYGCAATLAAAEALERALTTAARHFPCCACFDAAAAAAAVATIVLAIAAAVLLLLLQCQAAQAL
jgi:hypothetical protein